jgi:hypothetical protein
MASRLILQIRWWSFSVIRRIRLLFGPEDPKETALFQQLTALAETNYQLQRDHSLLMNCVKYDIDVTDPDFWIEDEKLGKRLSVKGRTIARKLIHEEKELRFANAERWAKLIVPIVASLVGIIGALTGLIAVLHRK